MEKAVTRQRRKYKQIDRRGLMKISIPAIHRLWMESVNVGLLWIDWRESGMNMVEPLIPNFIPCFIPREITKLRP